ncbi:MAG: tRNA (adenosine(37)-N6)-threonylcarbamoyltransferase complex dimerization subunit type 1 TsaB [Acidobacteriia bacterium]|nr:tRNA (adenosine(37)-N6)-threonylcarbamoyltransferase complex dimerization subunit type 1 TsaB [Terriglobia bacterium]
MLLLITDTSGKDGFVGLVRAEEGTEPDKVEVIEEVPLAGGTFSAQLVPQIAALLKKHEFLKTDIDAFVVVSGPGSFTGLRVGLAAIKALAEILQKPIVPVSLLEVLARYGHGIAAGDEAVQQVTFRYAVALDAGRKEAFVGQYEIVSASKTSHSFKCIAESLLDMRSLAELVESGASQWIATPDRAIADALKKRLGASQEHAIWDRVQRPRSAEIASVGWDKLRTGETVSPEQLEANYIRRSVAEIYSKPASSA